MNKRGPDKFFPHQTDSIGRQRCVTSSQIWISQIHIYFGSCHRERFHRKSRTCFSRARRCHQIADHAFINNAICCIHRNLHPCLNCGCSGFAAAFCPDYARNAQFPTDNRSMAGHSAGIRHNRFGFFHRRNPVRSRHLGNQNFAFLKIINQVRRQNHMGDPAHATRAGWQSFYQDVSFGDRRDFRFFFHRHYLLLFIGSRFVFIGPDGFRTGLDNPDFFCSLIQSPLHVHISAVMFLDIQGITGQLSNLIIRKNRNGL